MMKKVAVCLIIANLIFSVNSFVYAFDCNTPNEINIYCAPYGDDGADGLTCDTPLKTVNEAKNRVFKARKANQNAKITVYLRGGEYNVTQTTVFNKQDSGTKDNPVVYAAYKDEVPVFKGSTVIPIDNFKPLSKDEAVRVPEIARQYVGVADLKKVGIRRLTKFVGFDGTEYIENVRNSSIVMLYNDKEQNLAGYPNGINNYGEVKSVESFSKFTVNSDGRMKNWLTADNPMIYGWLRYGYSTSRVPVKSFNEKNDTVELEYDFPRGVAEGGLWRVTNLLEELDVPGEYYVDPIALKAYYYPPYKDDDGKIEIISNEQNMFNISNASYITFKNISFKNNRADAFEVTNSDHISFIGCKFRNIEIMAIDTMFCTNTVVDGCDFINIGSTGVRIDERDNGNKSEYIDCTSIRYDLKNDNNTVNNCYFWDIATQSIIYTGAIRVHGVGNNITRNSLHESRSSIIHHGGNDLKINNNEIWNGLKSSRDMGMVYNGRSVTQRGNETAYNYFHDWKTTNHHAGNAMGIYDDDCLGGNYKHHNIFANGETAVRNSGGPEGRFDYNICANNEVGASIGAQGAENNMWLNSMKNFVTQQVPRVYTLKEYEKYNNIKNLFFMNVWKVIGVTTDYNLFYNNKQDQSLTQVSSELNDMSKNIYDNGEKYKKYFNNPDNGDYTVRTDVEVPNELKEYQKIQLNNIGIYKSENRDNVDYKLGEFKAYYPFNYDENIDGKRAYFSWEKSENADEYIFELALDSEFKNVVLTEVCPYNYMYITNLASGKSVYYWRVTAVCNALKNREKRMCTNDVMVFRTQQYDELDTTLLASQIEKTQKQLDSMTEGTQAGTVAEGTKNDLTDLINTASKYLKMTKGDQNDVDEMTVQLQNELEKAFRESKVVYSEPQNMFLDESGWVQGSNADFIFKDEDVKVKSTDASTNATVVYEGEPMAFNKIYCFKIKPTVPKNATGGTWQAISFMEKECFGKKAWSVSGTQSLLAVIKNDSTELQIRDGVNSPIVLSSDEIFKMNEYNDVEIGIINFGAAQRCILTLNGKVVFDYLNTESLVFKELYFGMYDAPMLTKNGTTGISAKCGKAVDLFN